MSVPDHFVASVKRVLEHKRLSVNAASKRWRMPQKTLSMIINRDRTPNLATAEHIARESGYELWQLLQPDFDPRHPPLIQPATPAELAFYRSVMALMKTAPGSPPQ